MKLNDLEPVKKSVAVRALEENFDFKLKLEKMNFSETSNMLKRVRSLILETKRSQYNRDGMNPTYMKLRFMDQALQEHYNELLQRQRRTRIVLENEAVEEAQVTLAAQDLCNSVQKMLKDVGKMQIEELPALVDGIESEIGTNEAKAYEQAVGQQLDTLSNALKEAFQALKGARDALTGDEAGFSPEGDMGGDMGAPEMAAPEMGPGEPEAELPSEPSEEPAPAVGRGKR